MAAMIVMNMFLLLQGLRDIYGNKEGNIDARNNGHQGTWDSPLGARLGSSVFTSPLVPRNESLLGSFADDSEGDISWKTGLGDGRSI